MCLKKEITEEEKMKYLHQMQWLEEEASDCQQNINHHLMLSGKKNENPKDDITLNLRQLSII